MVQTPHMKKLNKAGRIRSTATLHYTPWHHLLLLLRFMGLHFVVRWLYCPKRLLSYRQLPSGKVIAKKSYGKDKPAT